jgi:CRP-like cAMP-binding protein
MNLDSAAFVADQELIQALRNRASAIDTSHEQFLFHQGDEATGLYIVCGGDVTVTMETPDGREVISLRALRGSLLGLPGLVGNCGYSLAAFAHRGAEVSFVPRKVFSELMLTEPQLSMMILRVLANQVRTARMALAGK